MGEVSSQPHFTINQSINIRTKQRSTNKKKRSLQSDMIDSHSNEGGWSCLSWCINTKNNDDYASLQEIQRKQLERNLRSKNGYHPNSAIRGTTVHDKNLDWFPMTEDKVDQIFRLNNQDCVPEWLDAFQKELQRRSSDLKQISKEFQGQFFQLVKKLNGSSKNKREKGFEMKRPRPQMGTIKRYLSEFQFQMLNLLKKQILMNKNHPIHQICAMFREEFGRTYLKLAQPVKNENGVYDKVGVIANFKERTKQLQNKFKNKSKLPRQDGEYHGTGSINSNDEYHDGAEEDEEVQINEINLTNQLIGEVQVFMFLMRWLIYEFYQFKRLKAEGQLTAADFDTLEDDILFILHKVTVSHEVYEILLVLSRLLHNKEDKLMREKYRHIGRSKSKLYPFDYATLASAQACPDFAQDRGPNRASQPSKSFEINPIFTGIIDFYQKSNSKLPFHKSIEKFRQVMLNPQLSPLDKLYQLQYLNITKFFERNKEFFRLKNHASGSSEEMQVVLTRDENILIMTYIMIQAGVPDLASQIELITAFTSQYMQESDDACLISQTYLQLIACQAYLESISLEELASF
mmetsp:Transcript_17368/g.29210  ORF Transcript_17368/g.29210 Transcript_17368/m.29210 type:complete len:574 (+) Transcript_17368:90-1811(+)